MRKVNFALLLCLVACGGGGGSGGGVSEAPQPQQVCDGKGLFAVWRNQNGKLFDFTGCGFSRPCLVDSNANQVCNANTEDFTITFEVDDSFVIRNCSNATADAGVYTVSTDCQLTIDYDSPAPTDFLN